MSMLNIVNRKQYTTFVPSPLTEYKTKIRINAVWLGRFDIDEWYYRLKEKNLAIDITNPEIFENGKRPIDGIFSPLFGADTTQDAPIYTCDCHRLTGGTNLGRWCEHCESYVRTIEADLRIPGFIDTAPYHYITYHGYIALSKIFKNLDTIISTTRQISKSGKPKDNGLPTIMDLYDDYDELYYPKTGLEKKYAFATKIPVFSSRMRPLLNMSPTAITLLTINQEYLSLVKLANIVRSAAIIPSFSREIEVQRTMNQIQQSFNAACAEIIKQCNTKNGVFRRALASGRLDNSTRMVITLGQDLRAHEVDVPYQTMMTQYEAEIADMVVRKENIPLAKAITMVQMNSMERNEYFVTIINALLRRKHGVWMLVNRNPTISKSGILYMRIRGIHDDATDMTLHLPQDILNLIAADFDGDQCTTVSVMNPKYHPLFITMDPTYAFVNRSNGKFNKGMGFMKDYAAILSTAWEYDVAYNNYLMDPEEDTFEIARKLGILNSSGEEDDRLAVELNRRALEMA
ncbi:MAG: hypothetical protein NC489_08020 [Ruminococcus flavefaciens]|nr:hypothetical protein [Ruminococcus flavefaciens]